ncbi:hypothetical protein PsorP6_018790 [Peronosclerospora sorghi]|nr:hypothetical protein PsorP6_018790 [Peronosclerospora sorghi]
MTNRRLTRIAGRLSGEEGQLSANSHGKFKKDDARGSRSSPCSFSDRENLLSSRSLTTVQDDEYFPSFLTALQSTPKADPSKESAPCTESEETVLSSKAKPRLTFAESLYMNRNYQQGIEVPDDSHFSFSDKYQTGLSARRRKKAGADNDREVEYESVAPPPTMSLLDPVGVVAGCYSVEDDQDVAATAARRNAAAVRSSYYPNVCSEEWGQDKQYWVTVFGFPSNAKSFILHQFQSMGEVVNYSSSCGGNWLHLRYHTRLQAEQALSYDGRTLVKNIMVGVKKCYPSDREATTLDDTTVSSYFGARAQVNLGSRDLEVARLTPRLCCLHDASKTFAHVF